MEKQLVYKIEISHRTIVFTVLFLILLWFIYQIRYLLTILFVGTILMAALNPSVQRLEKLRIPRPLAVMLVYLIIFCFFSLILAGVIPPLVTQTNLLISRLPVYYQSLGILGIDGGVINSQLNRLIDQLGTLSLNIFKLTVGIFGNFVAIFTLIFVSFYLLLERKKLDEYLLKLFGPENKKSAVRIFTRIERRLGEWVRAQVTLMIIVGIMSFFGLRLLGIDFALPLALLAGILEIVPNIGPALSAIPAILIGLMISPLMGLAVAALYFLVQQVENHLIVPQVMKREVGVNPLITILALVGGFKVGGGLGALLAIPFVILVETLIKEFFTSKTFLNKNT